MADIMENSPVFCAEFLGIWEKCLLFAIRATIVV